jgi:hypothetical protein
MRDGMAKPLKSPRTSEGSVPPRAKKTNEKPNEILNQSSFKWQSAIWKHVRRSFESANGKTYWEASFHTSKYCSQILSHSLIKQPIFLYRCRSLMYWRTRNQFCYRRKESCRMLPMPWYHRALLTLPGRLHPGCHASLVMGRICNPS